MKEPKVSDIKKYLNGILKINRKYVTTERLSKVVGLYPEIINETLSFFEPMITMDPEYNLMELVPTLKKYIVDQEENRNLVVSRKPAIHKNELEEFESINDFVYKKMTSVGGLLDRNIVLTDRDLRVLKKLIVEEQANRKNHK